MTYAEAYIRAKSLLKNSGVEGYAFDVASLFEFCFNIPRIDLSSHRSDEVPTSKCKNFFNLVEKRIKHEPLQYILGYCYFMGRKYFVSNGVLIPREDTEILVRKSVDFLKITKSDPNKVKVLDLCSGTGIVAISLASSFKDAEFFAIELYDKAFECLTKNVTFSGTKNIKLLNLIALLYLFGSFFYFCKLNKK